MPLSGQNLKFLIFVVDSILAEPCDAAERVVLAVASLQTDSPLRKPLSDLLAGLQAYDKPELGTEEIKIVGKKMALSQDPDVRMLGDVLESAKTSVTLSGAYKKAGLVSLASGMDLLAKESKEPFCQEDFWDKDEDKLH